MGQTLGNMKNSMPGFGGTNVADPGQAWGNMDSSQRGAAVMGGLGRGLGQGMQNYQQQNSAMRQPGGGGIGPTPGAQPVDPNYFQPQSRKRDDLSFYGGM